ncbi:MAG: ABATE domain-containing protein, partial [Gemmatimonadaceae bacterium]
MPVAPAASSVRSDLPFRFIAGDMSVDLVNTADWTAEGPIEDRLGSYDRLVTWCEEAAIVTPDQGKALRDRALDHPLEARAALDAATSLRWVLQRLYVSIANEAIDATAVDDFNCALDDAMRRVDIRLIEGETAPMIEGYDGFGVHLESPLWVVTRQAARLVT